MARSCFGAGTPELKRGTWRAPNDGSWGNRHRWAIEWRKHTLGIVGGSLLGGGYAFSGLMGFALTTECYVPGPEGRTGSRPCSAEPLYRAAPLLFIPVAGPFLALTKDEVQRDGGAVFWFGVFGAVQVTGAALLAYDLTVPHYGLRRDEGARTASSLGPRLWVAPAYLGQGPGVLLFGQL